MEAPTESERLPSIHDDETYRALRGNPGDFRQPERGPDPKPPRAARHLDCPVCGAKFRTRGDLYYHAKNAGHLRPEIRNPARRYCDRCGAEFKNFNSLERHQAETGH